jgi:hypothetical protein
MLDSVLDDFGIFFQEKNFKSGSAFIFDTSAALFLILLGSSLRLQ